jgi:hypothetical protein
MAREQTIPALVEAVREHFTSERSHEGGRLE